MNKILQTGQLTLIFRFHFHNHSSWLQRLRLEPTKFINFLNSKRKWAIFMLSGVHVMPWHFRLSTKGKQSKINTWFVENTSISMFDCIDWGGIVVLRKAFAHNTKYYLGRSLCHIRIYPFINSSNRSYYSNDLFLVLTWIWSES